MKKIITFLFTFVIALSCVSFTVSADIINQQDAITQIKENYGIDARFIHYENNVSNIQELENAAYQYTYDNGFTDKYFLFIVNSDYYTCVWSQDLNELFHSADSEFIADSILPDVKSDEKETVNFNEIENNFYSLISRMIENRTDCPYTYIKDFAGVLEDGQEKELDDKLTKFRNKNKFDLVVVLTNGIDPDDRMSFADDYYDYNGYGYGDSKDGVLLLVDIGAFDTYLQGNSWISTCGKGIDYIDNDAISQIGSELTPILLGNDFYGAVDLFPSLVENEINLQKRNTIGVFILITVIVCLIIAFVYCKKLKNDLKSVSDAFDADDYIVGNSLNITRSYDHFLYAHITKTPRESKSSSSSHTSSSGTSHGGGGF